MNPVSVHSLGRMRRRESHSVVVGEPVADDILDVLGGVLALRGVRQRWEVKRE